MINPINPKVMTTAAAVALILSMAAPTTGFAEYGIKPLSVADPNWNSDGASAVPLPA